MARRTFSGLLAGSVVGLLSGCGSRNTFRYKMTVEVETPQGIKSGFAVRELTFDAGSSWFPFGESKGRLYVKGEAVAVDVTLSKTLFALLIGQDGHVDYAGGGISTIFRVMDRDTGAKGGPHELWPKVPVIREPIINPVPMLVTFSDLSDPTSIRKVDPANLAASFEPGVKLRRITIEETVEPVTAGIDQRLGWLLDDIRKKFGPDDKPEGIPLGDYKRLFSRELSK